MDPNETMQLLREALVNNDLAEAAYLMKTLDEWLSKGGFLPRAWYAAARNTDHRHVPVDGLSPPGSPATGT